MLDMGPASWFFARLFLWIIGFPCYLVARGKLVRRREGLALLHRNGLHPVAAYATAAPAAAPPAGPPGWYADPSVARNGGGGAAIAGPTTSAD